MEPNAALTKQPAKQRESEPSGASQAGGNHAAVNPTGTAAALAACKRCAARRCDAAWRNDSADCLLARGQQHREQLQPSGAQERSGGTASSAESQCHEASSRGLLLLRTVDDGEGNWQHGRHRLRALSSS